MESSDLAPIILFVYNRPWHTRQTLEALQNNLFATESELFIYSDASKNTETQKYVDEVRSYIEGVSGFKKVSIIKREKNWGLSNSIIDGVTNIIAKYGKIIVLEDDIVTSPYFLKFMNEALINYEDEEKVWHVSGWNYPLETGGLDDIYLWRLMNCWGWGTWSSKWKYYAKDIDKTIKEFSKSDIHKLNMDGSHNFFKQVTANHNKKIKTWAIFWYTSIFRNNGLCLNPTQTFVKNIGHDGSGIHCGESSMYDSKLNMNKNIRFRTKMVENKNAVIHLKKYFKDNRKTITFRVLNRIRKFLS
jgi:hypothetical protein